MSFADSYIARARQRNLNIVFPEAEDARILAAACHLRDEAIATPVLVGSPDAVKHAARLAGLCVDDIEIADPRTDLRAEPYGRACAANRPSLTAPGAIRLVAKPLYFAGMMVRQGDAHAMVAGAAHSTRRVIEASLLTIGLAEGFTVPSSFFLMLIPGPSDHDVKAFIFSDCAVNISPTAEQLADIALASLLSSRALLEDPARIAMLSFSTKGSAQHPVLDKIKEALEIVRTKAPSAMIDGELQADAALVPSTARRKMREMGDVAGRANVLIFPDLNAGNIGYKLVQCFCGAKALGPFLQGFSKPVSDLSRGATVEEIILTCAIALIRA